MLRGKRNSLESFRGLLKFTICDQFTVALLNFDSLPVVQPPVAIGQDNAQQKKHKKRSENDRPKRPRKPTLSYEFHCINVVNRTKPAARNSHLNPA